MGQATDLFISYTGKLIRVRVADFQPPGLFKAIAYIDLVGLAEAAALARLVKSVESFDEALSIKGWHAELEELS